MQQVCRQDLPSKGRRCLSVSAAASAETVTTGTGLEMTEEQLPKSRVRLTVTVPPKIVKSSYAQAVKEGGELAIPGFRKGSAVCHRLHSHSSSHILLIYVRGTFPFHEDNKFTSCIRARISWRSGRG